MDQYDTIAGSFQDTIETIARTVDDLAPGIEAAAAAISKALLEDKKILACGNGSGAIVAQLLVCNLINRFEQERPGLPAMSLCSDSTTLSAIATAHSTAEVYSKQIRALGQSGDVLVCIANRDGDASLIQAIRAAHERDMLTVTLCSVSSGDISALLLEQDVEVCIDTERLPRLTELQTMTIHAICELVDNSLFGKYNS